MTDEAERFATPRIAAGALFVDDAGRVLLVHPTYKDTWDIPGGYVGRGESPAAACERELHEELGLDCVAQRLVVVDWAPNGSEGDKLLFIFDCGTLTGRDHLIRLQADELDRWEWVTPGQLESHLVPRLARRVEKALHHHDKYALYLQHGDTALPTSATT